MFQNKSSNIRQINDLQTKRIFFYDFTSIKKALIQISKKKMRISYFALVLSLLFGKSLRLRYHFASFEPLQISSFLKDLTWKCCMNFNFMQHKYKHQI